MTRDALERPRHGRRRQASSASAAGVLAGLKSLGKKDGEGAGKETMLTTARIRSKNGSEQRASRGRRRFSGGGSLCAFTDGSRSEERRNGEGKEARDSLPTT